VNTLRIAQLTKAHAEDLMAILWRALEERQIPSPQLNVSASSTGVDVSVGFVSEEDADLLMRTVPGLAVSG
jgi:hypothetical protein